MQKYSFWLTSILGTVSLFVLILFWNQMEMLQKLPVMYIVALALHEIEELKLPGGFIELVSEMTGLHLKNPGIAKFALFLLTIYATVIPAFLSSYIWPVMATLFIGLMESVLHLAAARANQEKFYSPGLVTAVFIQLPVAIYGYWYLYTNNMVKGIFWLWSVLFILIPLLFGQRIIVKANGLKYSNFINDALNHLLGRNGT